MSMMFAMVMSKTVKAVETCRAMEEFRLIKIAGYDKEYQCRHPSCNHVDSVVSSYVNC